MLLPSFVTNGWQLFAGSGVRAFVGRLWPMLAGIVLGTLVAVVRSARARFFICLLGPGVQSMARASV
ncbi:hypothetical protein [Paraburkholderia sp. 35.1]|uniref:hypothetical protein n=1 Tax=Paraburkholderia sp. 35.1 TaxID=2991058 RepID=UPI003D1E0649